MNAKKLADDYRYRAGIAWSKGNVALAERHEEKAVEIAKKSRYADWTNRYHIGFRGSQSPVEHGLAAKLPGFRFR